MHDRLTPKQEEMGQALHARVKSGLDTFLTRSQDFLEVVILPIDDQELCKYNRKMADKMFSQGKKIVIVKMKKPELPVPEVEFKIF